MKADLTIQCACGSVSGVARGIHPSCVIRVACQCDGCQDYARLLGRAPEILDERGCTEVIQFSPRRLTITEGREHLDCLQQTKGGALRWYAKCCDAPIANTMPSGRIPFVGVLRTALKHPKGDATLDEVVGPLRATVNHDLTKAEAKRLRGTKLDLLKMMARFVALASRWTLRGDQRSSPFFDSKTLEPVLAPRRLFESDSPSAAPRRD